MKRKTYIILIALLLCLTAVLTSCKDKDEDAEPVYFTVTFDSVGGSDVPSQRVLKDGTATVPEEPVREGYIFSHWEKDGAFWNFESQTVTTDVTLKAVWIDAASVYEYTVLESGNACITKYKGDLDVIKVPTKLNGLTVEAIGGGVFSSISSSTVKKIVVSDTVKSVGENAFSGCVDVKIEIAGELTHVGENAFGNCTALESVKLGEGLERISFAAFSGCTSLKSIVLPKGVTLISENAFEGCESLLYVIAPETLATVESSAFRDCAALVTVYYYGTEQSFDAISVSSSYNADFTEARLCLYSETEPTTDGDYWHYDERGNIRLWK
ncbi:MAG: hypothetical protein E7653_08025 [Ruminococcaceae bacterium]|nr:hypothetical protein [Oscillospiraceae bacterium]